MIVKIQRDSQLIKEINLLQIEQKRLEYNNLDKLF